MPPELFFALSYSQDLSLIDCVKGMVSGEAVHGAITIQCTLLAREN